MWQILGKYVWEFGRTLRAFFAIQPHGHEWLIFTINEDSTLTYFCLDCKQDWNREDRPKVVKCEEYQEIQNVLEK